MRDFLSRDYNVSNKKDTPLKSRVRDLKKKIRVRVMDEANEPYGIKSSSDVKLFSFSV